MSSIKISDKVYWVGKIDDRKVPFHRLILERGTTYNSYLLKTDKPTIIDTVDIMFGKEYVDNLCKIIDPETIEYIVINHVEPDHAGALPALAAKAKNAKIVATELGVGLLKEMFKLHDREFLVVRDGDTLDIGGKILRFYETPYLHTEETMITYSEEDGFLYSCDLFSTHIAAFDLFNDLVEENSYIEDYKVYYKLIMAPHRYYVREMLEKVNQLDIKMIAPSHGYILRYNPTRFIQLYDEMSRIEKRNNKVIIVYSTMTGNTAKVASKLSEGLKSAGVDASIFNLNHVNMEELKSEILNSNGILVGSSTRYGDMVGNTETLLKSLQGIEIGHKLAAVFGSYGWSGEAMVHTEDYLSNAGFQIINQRYLIENQGIDTPLFPLRVRFANGEGLDRAVIAGKVFGEQILMQTLSH